MIWISFARWDTKSDSMFIWERVYRNGNRWTPFIMAKIRYIPTAKQSDCDLPTIVTDMSGVVGIDKDTVYQNVTEKDEGDLSKLERYPLSENG